MTERPWDRLQPGETWRGLWDDRLPVLAARGTRPGPTFLVTAGVHGDEYEGPAAVQALFRDLPTDELSGRVIGLPVVNLPAWKARSRRAPGGGDLNRAFPGENACEDTGALAALVFTTFVTGCDALWDLHSGGLGLVHLPMAGWYAGGSGDAERLARGNGAGLRPWLIPDVPGVLSYEAHRLGKVAVGAEWGGGGRLNPAGSAAYGLALRATLAPLGMLPAPEKSPVRDARPPLAGDYQAAPSGGLFVPAVALGDEVAEGDELGTVYDTLGDRVCSLPSARAGVVAGLPGLPWLRAGDRAAYVG